MKTPFYCILLLLCSSCGNMMMKSRDSEVGIKDDDTYNEILRINQLGKLVTESQYYQIDQLLQNQINNAINQEKKIKLLNERSHNLAYQLFDLEESVKLDDQILSYNLSGPGPQLKASAAHNQILTAIAYADQFVNVSLDVIRTETQKRQAQNKSLLKGKSSNKPNNYNLEFLREHREQVLSDLNKTFPNTPEQKTLISRLMRAEYELIKLNKKEPRLTAYTHLLENKITLSNIDYKEINFLALSEYLTWSYSNNKNGRLYDMAIESLYKPYVNIGNDDNRFYYNNLINDVINEYIGHAYENKNYEDLLYYSSLNKSRMVLEDLMSSKNNDGQKINSNILPDKSDYKSNQFKSSNYLDFYVTTSLEEKSTVPVSKTIAEGGQLTSTRGFKSKSSNTQYVQSEASSIYISYLHKGNLSVSKISKEKTKKLKAAMSQCLQELSSGQMIKTNLKQLCKDLISMDVNTASELTISPDKWLNVFPMELLIGREDINRSLNLFTYNPEKELLSKQNLTGFFNPTEDLVGASAEYGLIKDILGGDELYHKKDATKANMTSSSKKNNLLHLSLHGLYDNDNPEFSKLILNGGQLDENHKDPNCVYAHEMNNIDLFYDNDLVFLAACQSGLAKSSDKNANEILGIVRPLITQNNKHIILTLWDIDDEATGKFVTYFYKELKHQKSITAAFAKAKKQIKKEYQSAYFYSPFYLLKLK